MKTKPVRKVVRGWAILGYPDDKPMPFGNLAKNFRGALSVFGARKDALKMKSNVDSWTLVKCEISYTLPPRKKKTI